jgi:hypothetical protein
MDPKEEVEAKEGAFFLSLKRNAKQIREDRARLIVGDTERIFRRKIEDIEDDIRKLRYRREGLIDLAPDSTTSTVVAPKDFDSSRFTEEDVRIGIEIRNLEITLEIAKERYAILFGVQ